MADLKVSRRQLLKGASAVGLGSLAGPVAAFAGQDAEEIGQGWCDAWNSHSADQVVEFFTDDVFYEDVPAAMKVDGSEELRAFAQGFFDAVPDVRLECTARALNRGGRGYIEWTFSGTDVGLFKTGKRFANVRGTSIIEVEGGKISRNSDYWDLATLWRQVGRPPGL